MFSGVAYRSVDGQPQRFGLMRLRQSTALIGATLLFCLTAGTGHAQDTLYYNWHSGAPSSTPDPQSGGDWGVGLTNTAWLNRQGGGGNNYDPVNFANNYNVVFDAGPSGTSPITVNIIDDVRPTNMEIEDGEFIFVSPGAPDAPTGRLILSGSLTVKEDATVELLTPVIIGNDNSITNWGTLRLSNGLYQARLINHNRLELTRSVVGVGLLANPKEINNLQSGTIIAATPGQTTELRLSSDLDNDGTLSGGTNGEILRITTLAGADATIFLRDDTQIVNTVILEGDIESQVDLDLVHVPVFEGDFTNRTGVTASVGVDANGDPLAVDGNGNDFINDSGATLEVTGTGSLTGLGTLENDGIITVATGASLGAATFNHINGSLTSRGTLIGTITAEGNATLSGAIDGAYTVADRTTTVDGDLTFAGTTGGGTLLTEGGSTSGVLRISDGVQLTVNELTNNGGVNFAQGGTLGVQLNGNLISSGIVTGTATISGDMTVTGSGGSYGNANLTVTGALINTRTTQIAMSDFGTISFTQLRNAAEFDIDEAVNATVVNQGTGDLDVNAVVTGSLISAGDTDLGANVVGTLQVTGGQTEITSTATVGVLAGPNLRVERGAELLVSGGTLTSLTTVVAAGEVRVNAGRTLIAPELIVQGDANNKSMIGGTVNGLVTVATGGNLELGSATITGHLDNDGVISTLDGNGAINLQNGFTNSGIANLGTPSRRAQISGLMHNQAGSNAFVYGDIVAIAGGAQGSLTNNGTMSLIGNVAYTVDNSSNLSMTGNAGRVFNTGTATVNGTVSGVVTNSGNGNLTLSGSVGGAITNTGTNAQLNVSGNLDAVTLTNTGGQVTVATGGTLDLASGTLLNGSGARLNVNGTLESSATATGIAVQNQAGGTLAVGESGQITGTVANTGTSNIAGEVTGDVSNTGNGTLNLSGTAEIGGTLDNQSTATLVSGASASVAGGTTNTGVLNVNGQLTSDVLNDGADTILRLTGGEIVGTLTNTEGARVVSAGLITGDVVNRGEYVLSGVTYVTGDFEHHGTLTQNVNNSELTIEGTLIVDGDIDAGGFTNPSLSIYAAHVNMVRPIDLGDGVRIYAAIDNSTTLRITDDMTLFDDLNNVPDGLVYVLADVTAEGDVDVNNQGRFTVSNNGTMTGLDAVQNTGTFTITQGSHVQAATFANMAGSLTNSGRLTANVTNGVNATIASTGTITGNLLNRGVAELAGTITGTLTTEDTATDLTTITSGLTVGQVDNGGAMLIEADAALTAAGGILNRATGTLTANGAITGNLTNNGNATLASTLTGNIVNGGVLVAEATSRVNGGLSNTGRATLRGTVTGDVTNSSNPATGYGLTTTGTIGGDLINSGTAQLSGSIGGVALNDGDAAVMNVTGTLTATGGIENANGQLTAGAGSVLNGSVLNEDVANLAGTVNGAVTNRSVMNAAGRIAGTLINEGNQATTGLTTTGNLRVDGLVVNRTQPTTAAPGQPQQGPGDPGRITVAGNTTLTAVQGVQNQARSILTVNGTLAGNVSNGGIFDLNNSLLGSLTTTGTATLRGAISGNVLYAGGTAVMDGDLSVGGNFDSRRNFNVAANRTLTVGEFFNRAGDHRLTVGGTIDGGVTNQGTLVALDGANLGRTVNTGTIDMTTNSSANDVVTVNGGLSGEGTYALNLDFEGNGGEGASDRIVVTGGAATGNYVLAFTSVQDIGPTDRSRRVLVFDVDESQGSANTFDFSSTGLPEASERIIYSIVQEGDYGDIYMTDSINPAFGAITGNVALTQSLIGSVVNRPSSPFVPGLAVDPGEQPCGPGAWARALAGRASAEGSTTNGLNNVASTIEASYRGIQFGGDLACFDGGFKGWNVAAGVIGGINDGTTSQPVYGASNTGVAGAENTVYSINDGEFRQMYGGIYLTASRDRLSADLQIRRERTSFKINNTPIGDDNQGLQISDSEFDSNATTISGSLSYSYQLPREGWMFVPTAGFAFSNISTDTIYFEDATLELEDSKNRVGFVGGTLSRTFVNEPRNSALLAFGTATVYKDFADDTTSIFTLFENGEPTRSEQLESSNLGVYGELSLGVNYLKVLNQGSARGPRQFNASVRLDGRSGDVLDSYGVTAQVRLQF